MGTMMRRAVVAARARPRRDGDADERAELLARFARQLRRYRTAAGFTQDRLAAKVGRPTMTSAAMGALSTALTVVIAGR
jgi:hypothetical protein